MGETSRGSARDRQDDKLILALLQSPSLEKAAQSAGISTATLWRRTQDPQFQEALRKARREAFSQAVGRLQHASNLAVNTLLRVMTDAEAPAASRVRAAECVLDRTMRAIELEDIDVRLSLLKSKVDEDGEN